MRFYLASASGNVWRGFEGGGIRRKRRRNQDFFPCKGKDPPDLSLFTIETATNHEKISLIHKHYHQDSFFISILRGTKRIRYACEYVIESICLGVCTACVCDSCFGTCARATEPTLGAVLTPDEYLGFVGVRRSQGHVRNRFVDS